MRKVAGSLEKFKKMKKIDKTLKGKRHHEIGDSEKFKVHLSNPNCEYCLHL